MKPKFLQEPGSPTEGKYDLRKLKILIFLGLWPAANVLFTAALLLDIGIFRLSIFIPAVAKIWCLFAISFTVISLIEYKFSALIHRLKFWQLLPIYLLVFMIVSTSMGPMVKIPPSVEVERVLTNLLTLLILQITVYLAIIRIIEQQQHNFEVALNLQEAELNVLRAQSNPHFLFNTLNLIVSEITNDAESAQEIVYDLADLMRANIKLAKQKFTSLENELRLIELYLKIQQKRFKDRLTYTINIDPESRHLKMPSLLLQPIVENAIKHGVAPYAEKASVTISTKVEKNNLTIEIKDSGKPFDDKSVQESDGLRILRKTLSLHYPNAHQATLSSSASGTLFSLSFPTEIYRD